MLSVCCLGPEFEFWTKNSIVLTLKSGCVRVLYRPRNSWKYHGNPTRNKKEKIYIKKKLHASTALSVLSSLLPVQNGAYRVPWSLYQYDILSLKLSLMMLEIHPKTQFMDAYILESCHVSPLKPKQKVALISRPLLRYGQIEFVSCPYDVCDIRLEAQRGREKDTAHKEWWEETRDHFSPAVRDLIFPPLIC